MLRVHVRVSSKGGIWLVTKSIPAFDVEWRPVHKDTFCLERKVQAKRKSDNGNKHLEGARKSIRPNDLICEALIGSWIKQKHGFGFA